MPNHKNSGLPGAIAGLLLMLIIIGAAIAAVCGYVDNILTLISADAIGIVEVVRIIGIFVAPVGVLLGWFA